MLKNSGNNSYLFCASNRRAAPSNTATIKIDGMPSSVTSAEVIGENRNVTVSNGQFQDTFSEWMVHLYKFNSQVAVHETPQKAIRLLDRAVSIVSHPVTDKVHVVLHRDLKGKPLTIDIFSMAGHRVRSLQANGQQAFLTWDRKDRAGVQVPEGLYYFKVVAGPASIVKTVTIIK
jgi:hypothetical protein